MSSQESRTDTGRSLTQPASSSVVVVNLWGGSYFLLAAYEHGTRPPRSVERRGRKWPNVGQH